MQPDLSIDRVPLRRATGRRAFGTRQGGVEGGMGTGQSSVNVGVRGGRSPRCSLRGGGECTDGRPGIGLDRGARQRIRPQVA